MRARPKWVSLELYSGSYLRITVLPTNKDSPESSHEAEDANRHAAARKRDKMDGKTRHPRRGMLDFCGWGSRLIQQKVNILESLELLDKQTVGWAAGRTVGWATGGTWYWWNFCREYGTCHAEQSHKPHILGGERTPTLNFDRNGLSVGKQSEPTGQYLGEWRAIQRVCVGGRGWMRGRPT